MKDYTGKTRNNLTAIRFIEKDKNGGQIWDFKCVCGNIKPYRVDRVFSKKHFAKTCNHNEYGPAERKLYREYKRGAKARDFGFDLSIDMFVKIVTSNCFYCGIEPLTLKESLSKNSSFLRNGIDRVDNNTGYEIDNCVPCCTICNRAKHTLEQHVFLTWIERIKKPSI